MNEETRKRLLRELGSLGGKARVAKMTPEQIRESARKAGQASAAARKARKLSTDKQ